MGILVVAANTALAVPVYLGDVEANSWGQAFYQSGVGNFNKMEAFLVGSSSGTVFEPGFYSLNNSWSATRPNPKYSVAVGSMQTVEYFSLAFRDPVQAVYVDILTYMGATLVERGSLANTAASGYSGIGGGWYWKGLSLDGSGYNRSVPDGGLTLAMLGMGLAGVGFVARRRS
jgi:hypothetical protein